MPRIEEKKIKADNRRRELMWTASNVCRRVRRELYEMLGANVKFIYFDYTGLCDEACSMVEDIIYQIYKEKDPSYNLLIFKCHGTVQHTSRVPSRDWELEHTWLQILTPDGSIYVDPTSSQFKDLFEEIPNYYVSEEPPKWWLPDNRNPAWSKLGVKLNDIQVSDRDGIEYGLYDYLNLKTHGKISDLIGKIKKKMKGF